MSRFVVAVRNGDSATVKKMLAEGSASIDEKDHGHTALLISAAYGRNHALTEWLLGDGGASITEEGPGGNVWNMLFNSFYHATFQDAPLLSLLKVMTLLDDGPANVTSMLPAESVCAQIIAQGKQLRTRRPPYMEQQRALLASDCPLSAVLLPLVAAYAEPTHEDMWTDWLGWRY